MISGLSRTVIVVLLAGACAGAPIDTPPRDPRPTPMASLSVAAAAAEARVRQQLADAGFGLEALVAEYRPAEPAELQAVPRAVLRIALSDRRAGHLLVYDPGDEAAAAAAGEAFADYLRSNFGQASYPPDAQFLLNRVGSTLLFGWWSPSRTVEPDQARTAFDALRGLGQPIPVR